jgi:ribonuclease HIII
MRSFQGTVDLLRTYIQQQHWSITQEKHIQNALQLAVTDGEYRALVICYSTGTVVIQGAKSPLQSVLQTWWNLHRQPETTTIPPHIGTDEVGKGDYFGPLVVAGVFVDEQRALELRALGVRDSKSLSDRAVLSLAEEMKRRLVPEHIYVLVCEPIEYNQRYHALQNLNVLLADTHARTIQALQQRTGCQLALVDQFDFNGRVEQALHALGCQITLEERPQGESDVAVAAASILGRATFLQQLEHLSAALQMELPRGSSNPQIVTIGKSLIAQFGREKLESVAKVSFQITQKILQ